MVNYAPKPRCSVEDCDNRVKAKGLCATHHSLHTRKRRASDPDARRCSVEGCDNVHFSTGYCQGHYSRLRRLGDVQPEIPLRPRGIKTPKQKVDRRYVRGTRRTQGPLACVQYPTDQEIVMPIPATKDPLWDPYAKPATLDAIRHHLRDVWGLPSAHRCYYCQSAQAVYYVYDFSDPYGERTDTLRGLLYSPDPANYQPACVACSRSLRDRQDPDWRYSLTVGATSAD